MKLNGQNKWAFLFIIIGALLLINFFGPGIAWIFKLIFPLALIFLGYVGLKNGKTFLGWALIIIGGLSVLSSMKGIIALIVAIVLIGYGLSMLRSKKAYD